MLDFVLKDVNPQKVTQFANFLAEMNDLTVLLTVAKGPYIAFKLAEQGENGFSLNLTENGYSAKFKGAGSADNAQDGRFELWHETQKIAEAYYAVREGEAVNMRVVLNVSGEAIAKKELTRAFQRDFSQSAHNLMKSPLQALKERIAEEKVEDESEAIVKEEVEESKEAEFQGKADAPVVPESGSQSKVENPSKPIFEEGEITEELELTPRAREFFADTRALLLVLNNICHDLTRGASTNFSDFPLVAEKLENGAEVEMLDDENNEYKVTFRRGSLNDLTEISFFLEKDGILVFSLYLSSAGAASITTQNNAGHIVRKKVADSLF